MRAAKVGVARRSDMLGLIFVDIAALGGNFHL